MQQRQYGCRMNQNHQHHHRCQNTQRITQIVIKLLLSITNRNPVLVAPTIILPLCLPSPAFPSSPWSVLRHRDDKSIPERLGRPPSNSKTSHHALVAIQPCTGNYYE
ncbi:hypothetical protein FQN60_004586 [Etheostoma spectabile]|uniref:Uncharacterized protein n=1 Tax=Etheostoma spectabile TaxID=54343 RepID=A0A5J5DKD1_9PERO|nr:hypothetical protein FQN60_004586 [Etheostoma spectabile]